MQLLLPSQLFPAEKIENEKIALIEHPKFFQEGFHGQKLVLHKASIQKYREEHDTEYYGLEDVYISETLNTSTWTNKRLLRRGNHIFPSYFYHELRRITKALKENSLVSFSTASL